MTPDEIEVALRVAFKSCDAASCPLTDRQKHILLLQLVEQIKGSCGNYVVDIANPLEELTSEELQAFLEFVKAHEQQSRSWKVQLLNDWLNENDSGSVQFIRDRYGLQWVNRIEPSHFAKYSEVAEQALRLKVGDRIEVSNGLWEWVQDDGPCSREWFPSTVIKVDDISDSSGNTFTTCIIRFQNGSEYEIQGMYEWNRFNWRWPQK